MEDHTGSFSTALEGVDILGIETADNEYAVGRVVEAVSHSPQSKDNTLVFVVEDDAQGGTDHVDAHRSIAIMAGAFVKRGAVVSKWYTTVSLISTIVDILGIEHLGLNDANAEPMADCFQKKPQKWTFNGSIPAIPKASTTGPLPVNARNVQPSNQVLVAKDSKLLHSAA
jgi:DNA-binding beta-propeller fold protein YncE